MGRLGNRIGKMIGESPRDPGQNPIILTKDRAAENVVSQILDLFPPARKRVAQKMGVSKNSGTSKSSIFIGFSIINHPFWGNYPYFWKHPYHLIEIRPFLFCWRGKALAAIG